MVTKTQVITAIERAWPNEDYGPDVDADLKRETPHPEERDACEAFLGKRWREVSTDILLAQYPSPFLIGDHATCYFLAAHLLAALHVDDWHGTIDALIHFRLLPPKKAGPMKGFEQRYATLTNVQRTAVALFLQYAKTHIYSSNSRASRRIEDALDRYWRRLNGTGPISD